MWYCEPSQQNRDLVRPGSQIGCKVDGVNGNACDSAACVALPACFGIVDRDHVVPRPGVDLQAKAAVRPTGRESVHDSMEKDTIVSPSGVDDHLIHVGKSL